jgi:hypothetical protein
MLEQSLKASLYFRCTCRRTASLVSSSVTGSSMRIFFGWRPRIELFTVRTSTEWSFPARPLTRMQLEFCFSSVTPFCMRAFAISSISAVFRTFDFVITTQLVSRFR